MFSLFFFNATATTEIYTLSLHDALPIWSWPPPRRRRGVRRRPTRAGWSARRTARRRSRTRTWRADRKSTRLNSSHVEISYAVFCLKKKKRHTIDDNKASQCSHRRERDIS